MFQHFRIDWLVSVCGTSSFLINYCAIGWYICRCNMICRWLLVILVATGTNLLMSGHRLLAINIVCFTKFIVLNSHFLWLLTFILLPISCDNTIGFLLYFNAKHRLIVRCIYKATILKYLLLVVFMWNFHIICYWLLELISVSLGVG